jgi:hypothetical protein
VDEAGFFGSAWDGLSLWLDGLFEDEEAAAESEAADEPDPPSEVEPPAATEPTDEQRTESE